jgi:hypothetical protein
MIRAAVIPYGNAGIIIADDASSPPRVLLEHTFEVGRLVDRNVERDGPGPKKRREVTPEDASSAAAIMVAHLTAHGAQRVAVEVPEGDGAAARTARTIGDALAFRASLAGVAVAFVGVGWRKAPDAPTLARGASVLVQAAALLAFDAKASAEELAAVERAPELHVEPALTPAPTASAAPAELHVEPALEDILRASQVEPAPPLATMGHVEPATAPHVGRLPPGTLTLADLARGASVDDAPTVAGCDAGPAQLAIGVVAGESAPFHLVASHTFKVIRDDAPIVLSDDAPADGKARKGRRAAPPTDEETREVAARAVDALKAARVKRLVIETTSHVFFSAGLLLNAAASKATELLLSDRFATVLALLASQAGIEVVRAHPLTIRARTVGKGNASDEEIAARLPPHFDAWPSTSNNHERDGIAAALYGAMPAAVEPVRAKGPRASKGPQERGEKRAVRARQRYEKPEAVAARVAEQAARAAEREAAGCSCARGPHRRECPLYKPRGHR